MKNGGPQFGGGSSFSFSKGSNPPNLADYSNEPKYDLATVVQIVRVRPMILWGWEQQLGIPAPVRVQDDSSNNGRRYSERDIVASLWLREQILNGILPNEAAAKLLGSHGTRAVNTGSLAGPGSGALSAQTDDLLRSQSNFPPSIMPMTEGDLGVQRSAKVTRRFSEQEQSLVLDAMSATQDPWNLQSAGNPQAANLPGSSEMRSGYPSGKLGSSYPGAPGASALPNLNGPNMPDVNSGMGMMSPTSGPLSEADYLGPTAAPGTGSLGRSPITTRPNELMNDPYVERPTGNFPPQRSGMTTGSLGGNYSNYPNYSGYQAPPSGPLQTKTSGGYGQMNIEPITRQSGSQFMPSPESSVPGIPWSGPGAPMARSRELRLLLPQLIRAFNALDTASANFILNEAQASRSIETICIGLLLPALARVSDLTSQHEMSITEEQFALNYARSFLFSIFHRTPERIEGPLTFVSCGPKEMSEIHALTLAVFWRRAGLRVAYFGQDVDKDSLIAEVRKRRPALVALTATSTQRVRSLSRLAKALNQLDTPRPFVGYAGPLFVRNQDLQHKINAVYLGDDAANATWHVTNLLGTNRGAAVTTSMSGPQPIM